MGGFGLEVELGCHHGTWTLGLASWWEQLALASPAGEISLPGVQRGVPDHRLEAVLSGTGPSDHRELRPLRLHGWVEM